MTTAEKKIKFLFGEIRTLKARLERLVPLDDEGEYKNTFLKKLDRSHASKTRFVFSGGQFSRAK
ncbi:MAG: hypothetical protein HZB12_02695 [Candidatus Yonathbacteria bacterium]|nr:hypothetical protein [Candidatus Yonathbacteria bacterium]